ncbi:MAG: hypothetical protein Q9160_000938 [Pyrenula sp. 1 TL-2023]
MVSNLASLLATALLTDLIRAAPLRRDNVSDPFAVLDPQNWVNPDDMTWADFKPVPGISWNDPSRKGSIRNFNIALVTVDYSDAPFVITQPAESSVFGNPQPIRSGLSREDVPAFYHDFLNVPNELNNYHTLHEYWMQDSAGRYGVDLTVFGAYQLPSKSFQYGIDDDGNGAFNPGACPEAPCSVDLRTDALGAWRADIGNETASQYELAFILSSGQDESSTWQEFGPILFENKEDVTDAFGPPDNSTLPNYAKTRYVEWTSWASAATIWPNAGGGSSTQAESSGAATYAHELSHLLGIGDNYNNPYGVPARRAYTGPFSMMDRGSFNGPGGPHTRWQIPAQQGASLGSLHTMRDKLQLGLVDNSSVLILSRSDLLTYGSPLVAQITARAIDPRTTVNGLMGVRVQLPTGDLSPTCNTSTAPLCDGGGFNNYDMEVVDRMGADSFAPDSGVLLSKTKDSDRTQPFQWVVDANPQDIDVVDFVRPDGTEVKLTVGDYRQLADALFHAGTRSGSEFEFNDTANGLQFYVLQPVRDASGILRYDVAVRALDAATSATSTTFGVNLGNGSAAGPASTGTGTTCTFSLTNTGSSSADNTTALAKYFTSDIYRLSASVEPTEGWRVEVPNALATAEFDGGSATVSVAVGADAGAAASEAAVVTLTVTSESDESVQAVGTCSVGK